MNTKPQAPWLWLSALVVLLDQLTKIWVEAEFQLYESLPVFPGFNLVLVYNRGAAFSFLSDQSGWQRWFFIVLALLVSIALLIWILRLSREERLVGAALALILGGAFGNLIDRTLYGHVIDFLDFYVGTLHWPAFNVADSAIVLGVILMLWDAFFYAPAREQDAEP